MVEGLTGPAEPDRVVGAIVRDHDLLEAARLAVDARVDPDEGPFEPGVDLNQLGEPGDLGEGGQAAALVVGEPPCGVAREERSLWRVCDVHGWEDKEERRRRGEEAVHTPKTTRR